jgi:hypothetical protein
MEKLVLAQDTSNVDDTGMSSEEIRERNKKRRRMKAKRTYNSSSSSSSSEDELVTNKENCPTQNKKLPLFPQIQNFISSSTPQKDISTQQIENTACDIYTDAVSNNETNI